MNNWPKVERVSDSEFESILHHPPVCQLEREGEGERGGHGDKINTETAFGRERGKGANVRLQ